MSRKRNQHRDFLLQQLSANPGNNCSNGSGKSAVLTAITICLGGKATATNRGQSLKSFIKEGEE